MKASLKRGIRMSLITVVKPHRKNSDVMIANGPRYVWPFAEPEAELVEVDMDAIEVWLKLWTGSNGWKSRPGDGSYCPVVLDHRANAATVVSRGIRIK